VNDKLYNGELLCVQRLAQLTLLSSPLPYYNMRGNARPCSAWQYQDSSTNQHNQGVNYPQERTPAVIFYFDGSHLMVEWKSNKVSQIPPSLFKIGPTVYALYTYTLLLPTSCLQCKASSGH